MLVRTIPEGKQSGGGPAEIDHDEEKGRKRIETEMRPKPRNSERKSCDGRISVDAQKSDQSNREKHQRRGQTNSVDEVARTRSLGKGESKRRSRHQLGGTAKCDEHQLRTPLR